MIRKSIKSLLIILITTVTTYFGFAGTIDPAVVLSYTDLAKDEIISEIENDNSEKIYLKAGNEKFGFSHILKRHSGNYFTETVQKGNLFPTGTTGKQIIKGIETAYKNGDQDPKAYGNKKVLLHELNLNGEKGKYRLVINEDKEVITFFRLKNS